MASQEEFDVSQLAKNARKGAMKANKKSKSSNTKTYIAVAIFGLTVAAVIGLLILNPERPPHLIPVIDAEYIEQQNLQKIGFTQKANTYFQNWTLADVKLASQTGISQQAKNMSPCTTYMNEGDLVPLSFDLREEYPGCIQDVLSQGNCSSGYAFAAASITSERYCIVSNGTYFPTLSTQEIVSCSKKSTGCTSGNIDTVWSYIRDSGLVEEYCFPYTTQDMKAPECSQKCDDTASYYVKDVCATASESGLMREIKNNGPVVALIQIYTDFLTYSRGVYKPHLSANKVQGRQAVEVIGWGTTDENVPYWIIKNSWGPDWGEGGYGLVIRGDKDLGLEDFAVTASPALTENPVETLPEEVNSANERADLNEFENLDSDSSQNIPQTTPQLEEFE
jgi:cathepsin B